VCAVSMDMTRVVRYYFMMRNQFGIPSEQQQVIFGIRPCTNSSASTPYSVLGTGRDGTGLRSGALTRY